MPFPPNRLKKRIGELLVDAGLISQEDIKKALAVQKEKGGLLGEVLVQQGIVKESDIAYALAKQFNLPYVSCEDYLVSESVKGVISLDQMKKEGFIVLDKIGKLCVVAFAIVPRVEVLQQLGGEQNISALISTPSAVNRALDKNYTG